MLNNIVNLILVGFLWGTTNPFIKIGSKGIENIKYRSKFQQIYNEIKFLITRWQYLIPFILNQTGSVIYIMTLQKENLSIAVPIANSLSFIFTDISARILGEKEINRDGYIGIILISIGSILCMYNKI